MAFCIAEFFYNKSVALIHASWIKKGVISWPSFTGDRLNKAIVRGENPDSSWTTYQGRVVGNKYFGEF
jgi:hypothetical protein